MKKIILLFLPLLLVNSAFAAETMIFNKSKNDIEISYRFCTSDQSRFICQSDISTITVHGTQGMADKNFAVISAPSMISNDFEQRLVIFSALEKNQHGDIISQSDYSRDDIPISTCTTPTALKYIINGVENIYSVASGVILDDMDQSPVITCQDIFYGKIEQK